MRACTKCGEVKPLDQFPPKRRGEPKRHSWCRDCFAAYGREWYRRNREREKARRVQHVNAKRAEVRARIVDYLRTHPCVDCGERDIVVLEFDHVGEKVADISQYANGGRSWAKIEAEIARCEIRCANCHRRKTLRSARSLERAATDNSRNESTRRKPVQLQLEVALGVGTCRVCGLTKPLSEFPFRSVVKQTRQRICLLCQREYTARWYARNRESHISKTGLRRKTANRGLRQRVREYLLVHSCVDCGETDPDVLDFDHLGTKRTNVSRLVHTAASWDSIAIEISKCEVRCANCHRRRTARLGRYYRHQAVASATIQTLTP